MDEFLIFQEDGKVFWKKNYFPRLVGTEVGSISVLGYRVFGFNKTQYKTHRVIFAYHTGSWPKLVDHINGDRLDNRIENLREISHHLNSINSNKTNGRVPYRGVYLSPYGFGANIQSNGKREFLGHFPTAQEASRAYLARREELHPNFVGVIK